MPDLTSRREAMKPPVDRQAALVATLALAFVVSVCLTIYVTHVEHFPHFGFGGVAASAAEGSPPR
jgi:hypothetical protein